MSPLSLTLTLAFVVIAAAVSVWQRLEIERELLVGTVRAAVQLLAVGYVLLWVFDLESWYGILAMLSVMLLVAARSAVERGKRLPGSWPRVLAALVLTTLVTMGLMLMLGIIPATAQYIIPIAGMVTGNAMVVAGLFLNRIRSEVEARRGEIEVWLSLGAPPRQAMAGVVKAAVKAALIPSVESLKTVGLVQLPGMMTGQILAGANPVEAVKYQILIVYALAGAGAVCSMTLGALSVPLFINLRSAQLLRLRSGR